MKRISQLSWSFLAFITAANFTFAKGGDSIREKAPIAALILDARDGNEGPLKDAYFNKEIDYFLDIESPRSSIARDLLNLREAGRAANSGDPSAAESRIQTLSKFADEQTYLKGIVAAAKGQYPQSLEFFRQLIDKRTDISRNLASLAFIGAARVFHELKDYKAAIYHYNQARYFDALFFQSIFEKSWSFYLMGDMNGSLGTTLTFLSPYAEDLFYPEALVVRAASFFQLCYFERASIVIEKLKRDFEPLRTQINQLIARGPQSWLFDDNAMKKIPKRVTGALVADRDFRAALRAYLALKEESKSLRGNQIVNSALQFVKQKMLDHAKRVLDRSDKHLRDILAQADIIQIEILQSGANLLMGIPPEHTVPVKTTDLGSVDFDEMVQFWPFKGEWWVDELGSYYYGLKSNCES